MESVDAWFLLSPGSVLVAFVAVAFLLRRTWPRTSGEKQAPTLLKTTGLNNSYAAGLSVSKEAEVPEGWWTGREVFELERRALFSQAWIYVAHSTQFSKPGSYQSFDVAGFPIFLIRGKDSQIRAFHNVCRHRAYTITRKETGASTVLGCKYHGWSYDTRGRLVKAPQFDDVPGFDKAENGLFEIHTRTTEVGWIFVNLSASQPVEFDSSVLSALNEFATSAKVGSKSEWVAGKTLTGAFNWKLGIQDRYFGEVRAQLEKQVLAALAHSLPTRLIGILLQQNITADCSLFPNTLLYSFKNTSLWLSLTYLPTSETSTQVRYDLFDSAPKADTDEDALSRSIEQVFRNLIKNTEFDFSSASRQKDSKCSNTHWILNCLQEHSKLEKTRGRPIMPATRLPKASSLFQQAEQLCKEIDCAGPGSPGAGSSLGSLDW